jgi:hypothetical protein
MGYGQPTSFYGQPMNAGFYQQQQQFPQYYGYGMPQYGAQGMFPNQMAQQPPMYGVPFQQQPNFPQQPAASASKKKK